MLDLLIRNATLPDGRGNIAIGCKNGRIAAAGEGLTAAVRQTINAQDYLVSPPFIDSHFHMNATLSLGLPRLNMSSTLLDKDRAVGRVQAAAHP